MQLDNKKILLTNDSLLLDIQAAFTACYPFLKIEFLKAKIPAGVFIKPKIDPQTSLRRFLNANLSYKFDINSTRTISEISDDFKNLSGISVEVSRKSGKVWNVISLTGGWTLESQNTEGEFISSLMDVPAVKAIEDN